MKVLIDRGNAPSRGGIGVFSANIIRAVKTFCPDSVNIEDSGISRGPTGLRPLYRLIYLSRLYRLRQKGFHTAEVVHFTNYYVPPRLKNVSFVSTIHDIDPIAIPEVHTRRYVYYFRYILEHTLKRTHAFETHTEAIKNEVIERFNVDSDSVRVVGDGLSPEFITAAKAAQKHFPDQPSLLFVGQLNRKKNVAWLTNAVVSGVLTGALPKLTLVLAGSPGFGSEEVLNEVRASAGIVRWQPSPSLDQLVALYRSSSMLILPSLREGFGRPLLEAMYCSVPIVASRIPSSLEVAGDAALYFALHDRDELYHSIRETLSGRYHANQQAVAQQRLSNYSWRRLAPCFVELYRESQVACNDK